MSHDILRMLDKQIAVTKLQDSAGVFACGFEQRSNGSNSRRISDRLARDFELGSLRPESSDPPEGIISPNAAYDFPDSRAHRQVYRYLPPNKHVSPYEDVRWKFVLD